MNLFLRIACGFILFPVSDRYSLGGSCFAYRDRHHVLTAAHCVPEDRDTLVYLPGHAVGEDPYRPVERVERHPTLDVARLTLPERDGEALGEHVVQRVPDELLGEGGDVLAFGYPIESNATGPVPVGRTMRGYVQRYFPFENPYTRNTSLVAELSIPFPAGSSGGPVVLFHDAQALLGIITASADSYTVTDYVEEEDVDGNKKRTEARRVVAYGIAELGVNFTAWLDALEA